MVAEPCVGGVVQGGYTGGVWGRVGTGEGYTGTPSTLESGGQSQRSGPRKGLQGPGVGGDCLQRPPGQVPTPAGPGRSPAVPSLVPARAPRKCRLLANKPRYNLILLKVSQNSEVSTKYVNKACHSPYIQNGSQKSPLEILRFPILTAFSHKELMGLF